MNPFSDAACHLSNDGQVLLIIFRFIDFKRDPNLSRRNISQTSVKLAEIALACRTML